MKKEPKPEPKERWILALSVDGEFKIRVPEGGNVTFGPALPGVRKGGNFGDARMEYALRVYGPGGAKDLRAVFTGIREFRDLDLPHSKAIVKEAGKTLWKSDETGYEVSTSVKKDKAYLSLEDAKINEE